MLTPSKSFLLLGVVSSVPLLVKIDQEMRTWVQTDRQTDTHCDTETNWFYNLSHAIAMGQIKSWDAQKKRSHHETNTVDQYDTIQACAQPSPANTAMWWVTYSSLTGGLLRLVHRGAAWVTVSGKSALSRPLLATSNVGILFMAALCNRGPLYFCPVVSIYLSIYLSSSFIFLA